MHHRPQPLTPPHQIPQQPRHRTTIRHITTHHRHPHTQTLQPPHQLPHTRRTTTTPTHQHHMLRTHTHRPQRHPRTQRPRTTRHQHRPRQPKTTTHTHTHTRTRTRRTTRTHQPPHKHTRRPQRHLILNPRRQHPTQPTPHTTTQHTRQIHQTTPPQRHLQTHHPTQTPHRTTVQVGQRLGVVHGDGTAGQPPQPTLNLGDCKRLRDRQCLDDTGAGQRHQRDHPGDRSCRRRGGGQPTGDPVPVQLVKHHGDHLGAPLSQPGQQRVVLLAGDHQHQPGAGQVLVPGHVLAPPHHAVAPGVHRRPLLCGPPPLRELGQDRAERFVRADTQLAADQVGVAGLHGRPEPPVESFAMRVPAGRGRRLGPVPGVVEGVRGQVDHPRPGAGLTVVRSPVDRHTRHPQLPQRRRHRGDLRLVPPRCRNPPHPRIRDDLRHHRRQRRIRTHLQEGVHPQRPQRHHTVGEAHRLPHVPHPVLRIHQLQRVRHGTRHVRHHPDARHPPVEPRHHRPELLQHRLHQPRVERVTDRELLHPPTPLTGGRLHRGHLIGRARDDHRRGAVDRRDVHGRARRAKQLGDSLLRRADGRHHATGRQRLHQPTPRRHQRARIPQGQHPRHVRRRHLTDGVTRQVVGPYAPRREQLPQRHLDREQPRLREHGLIQQSSSSRTRLREHHLAQRTRQQAVETRAHLVERRREHRERVIQLPAHPGALRTLTREQHRPTTRRHHTRHRRPALGHRRQAGNQLVPRRAPHHRPMLQRRPGRRQRPRHIRRRQGPGPHERRQPPGLTHQSTLRTTRHHPRHRQTDGRALLISIPFAATGVGRRGNRQPVRRSAPVGLVALLRTREVDGLRRQLWLLDDHVRVRPRNTERRHTRSPHTPHTRPLTRGRHQLHRTRRPIDMRRRSIHMQRRGDDTRPHCQDHLDHTRHPRSRLRVTDVRLHRPQQQRHIPTLPIRRQQRLRLDRITQRRTRTVRLHHIHISRRQTRKRQSLTDHPLLRRTIRRRQTIRRTILIHRRTPHHRQNPTTRTPRIRQPLHDEDADALAPRGAVRRLGEGLAAAVGRQPALAGELDEGARGGHHRDAAGQREVALPRPQRLRRQVQRHERRGTRRVHSHGRPLEPERVRHPTRQHARGGTRRAVPGEGLPGLAYDGLVVLAVGAGEHPDAAAAQREGFDPGVLERLPGDLEQQSLLRVHGEGLARRDAEELRVEATRVGQEGSARDVGVGAGQRLQVPVPVGREVRHRVGAGGEQLPEALRGLGSGGETAAHADDDDRVVAHDGAGDGGGGGKGLPAQQFGVDVPGEGGGVRVVEGERARQREAGRRVEPVAQFDGCQRGEAEVLERPVRRHPLDGLVAEHGGDLGAYQVAEDA